jgi:glycosyltransferase involved in cell wall biosynthesis
LTSSAHPEVTVQVIVPARNEEDCLGRCLESLVSQQGIDFAVTVVDDNSSDRTYEIAKSFPGVTVIRAPEPKRGISGKCNALVAGAGQSSAKWLLFTDADTFHYPGSLARAVHEAEGRGVDLLSYSPEQETGSLAEEALLPVVFAELVRTYSPERINDPTDPAVAANGQYVLVRRAVYEELGGHCAIEANILEDVELARLFKASQHKIWFRYGAGMVRTRMYRSFKAMVEGWTKNLVLLFPYPRGLAALRGSEFAGILGLPIAGIVLVSRGRAAVGFGLLAAGSVFYANFLRRIRRAHFPWRANLLSLFGLPLFVSLLARSYIHSRVRGAVQWKGREYAYSEAKSASASSINQSR